MEAERLKMNADSFKDEFKYDLALESYSKSLAIFEEIKGKYSL